MMTQPETIHRYPRIVTWVVELVASLAVVVSLINLSAVVLRFLWRVNGIDNTFFSRFGFLYEVVGFVDRWTNNIQVRQLTQLLPALFWMLLALLFALILRNAFPVIRTSSRGILVEFANSWLPLSWTSISAIKVTADLSGTRYVLLAQTDPKALTGWHRLYSLFYNLRFRRGFWINSMISDFDGLLKTILDESAHSARLVDNAKPVVVDEAARSPLFSFLLSPAAFFSHRNASDSTESASVQVEQSKSVYPARINLLFSWGSILLAILAAWSYFPYWIKFMTITMTWTHRFWPFNATPITPSEMATPWMQLIAAHLMIVVVIIAIMLLNSILPALETSSEGLRVKTWRGWHVLPWSAIDAVKITELSEGSHAVLVQSRAGLPASFRAGSFIYDNSGDPGVLITSAISNFEPLLQRIILAVAQAKQIHFQEEEDLTFLQRDARAWMLQLIARPSIAIDYLVEKLRANEESSEFSSSAMLKSAMPMVLVALPFALLPTFYAIFERTLTPGAWLISQGLMLFLMTLIEWPLAGILAAFLDESTGGGEEGQRMLYLYPQVQLPRILLMLGVLVFMALNVPALPFILWLGAIVWSFFLTAGACEALFGWKGSQLLLGGLFPVGYQLIVMMLFLLTQR
jgi:hypothetical protein